MEPEIELKCDLWGDDVIHIYQPGSSSVSKSNYTNNDQGPRSLNPHEMTQEERDQYNIKRINENAQKRVQEVFGTNERESKYTYIVD